VEVQGTNGNTVFILTLPGPAISGILATLRKSGIGTNIGRILLYTLEFVKPGLDQPLAKPELQVVDGAVAEVITKKKKKPKVLKGYDHFKLARKTTEELHSEISNGANMTVNTWANLIGASIMAAGGLSTSVTVFIVASMLVSPIMGPIIGMVFGYRVADYPLFKMGLINEFKMAAAAFMVGICYGILLGDIGSDGSWPSAAMLPTEKQDYQFMTSVLVSAAAGTVLGVSLTSTGGNPLVGTAISAGLLPPLVNAGMLIAFSFTYAPLEQRAQFYEMGNYALLFYLSHVVTIVLVANGVFWLKDINKNFRDGEDQPFDKIESLQKHRERLQKANIQDTGLKGSMMEEKVKAEYFINALKDDAINSLFDVKDKAEGFANLITGGLIPKSTNRRKTHKKNDDDEDDDNNDIENGPKVIKKQEPIAKVDNNRFSGGGVSSESSSQIMPTIPSSHNEPSYTTISDSDLDLDNVNIDDDSDIEVVHNPLRH